MNTNEKFSADIPSDQRGIIKGQLGFSTIFYFQDIVDYEIKNDEWKKDMTELSKASNVYCKFSGILTEVGPDYTKEQLDPYIDFILNIFGSDKLDSMLKRLGMKDGESIAHPWVSKALERAQGKVEARNFDLRKNILKYDDVVNVQRKEVFSQRRNIMETADVSEMFENIYMDIVEDIQILLVSEKHLMI